MNEDSGIYGFDMESIAHTKAIYYPYMGHSLCHTIPILGPYMAHITRFGKGSVNDIMIGTLLKVIYD